jgi:hypothetical protein
LYEFVMLVRIGLLTTASAKFEPGPHINAAQAKRSRGLLPAGLMLPSSSILFAR